MRRIFLLYAVPPLGWAALMMTVSSTPGDKLPEIATFWEWDKVAHAFEYAVLSFLSMRFLWSKKPKVSRFALAVLVGAALALFGGLDEIHQRWIPNRTCSWYDWTADVIGISCGIGIYFAYARQKIRALIQPA